MERIKSGIPGFDKILYGGFPKGSVVMISGSAGTGKTIFCLQSLCHGAKNGEKGLYITFEQPVGDIVGQGNQFDWGIGKLIKSGKLRIVRISHDGILSGEGVAKVLEDWKVPQKLIFSIMKEIKSYKPRRVVIDSLSTIGSTLRSSVSDAMKRDMILDLVTALKEEGLDVAMVTSELPRTGDWYSNDGISEFLVDGIVVAHRISTGMGSSRMISIEKMRKTNHSIDKLPLEIRDNVGIVIRSEESELRK